MKWFSVKYVTFLTNFNLSLKDKNNFFTFIQQNNIWNILFSQNFNLPVVCFFQDIFVILNAFFFFFFIEVFIYVFICVFSVFIYVLSEEVLERHWNVTLTLTLRCRKESNKWFTFRDKSSWHYRNWLLL